MATQKFIWRTSGQASHLICAYGLPEINRTPKAADKRPAPSPGTPGEGWGEGDFELRTSFDEPNHPGRAVAGSKSGGGRGDETASSSRKNRALLAAGIPMAENARSGESAAPPS